MASTEVEIKSEITAYINKNGGSYPAWYVGIAKDPAKRLFEEHGVLKNSDAWIYREAQSNAVARNIESYFINTLGADGGPGGGGWASDCVYAYRKNAHTDP